MKAIITVHKIDPIEYIINRILGIETRADDSVAYQKALMRNSINDCQMADDVDCDLYDVAVLMLVGKI